MIKPPIKNIKDPVHGFIKLNEEEIEIVDSLYFQRLRNITQLATTQMVYPGARHSRFEHSLGVFHLSKLIFNEIKNNSPSFTDGLGDNQITEIEKTLRFAALLHDIGHYPFSHLGETFESKNVLIDDLEKDYGFITKIREADNEYASKTNPEKIIRTNLANNSQHELSSCLLILNKYDKTLEKFNVDPFEVCAFILGFSFKKNEREIWQFETASKILNSNIDADKLDYILRDKKMSGASIVSIDGPAMIMAYVVSEKKLALSMKAFSIINNFLESREAVYMWVCQHHKVVFSNALLKKMISSLPIESKKNLFSYESILNNFVDDYNVVGEIRINLKNDKCLNLEYYYDMFRSRKYLKSCWKHIADFREKIRNEDYRNDLTHDAKALKNEVEEYITSSLGISRKDVFVEFAEIRAFKPSDKNDIIIACSDGRAKKLSDLNLHVKRDFVKPLPYVYVPEKYVDDVIDLLKDYTTSKLMKIIKTPL